MSAEVPRNPDGSVNVELLMLRVVGSFPDSARVELLRAALNLAWSADRHDDRGSPYRTTGPNLERFT